MLFTGAHAHFRVGSFAEAANLVAAIAEIAEIVGHCPDVDVRPEGVTVRTASGEYGALTERDVELAIAVAQDAGIDVGPFWAAALGYRSLGPNEDVVDRHRRNPHVSFQRLRPPRPGRGRTHIDVSVPADQAEARVKAALEAGGRLADDAHVPNWWTLASPENHGVDIAAWPDFEDDRDA